MPYVNNNYAEPIHGSVLIAAGTDRFSLFDLAGGDLALIVELVSERPVAGRRKGAKLHFCHSYSTVHT